MRLETRKIDDIRPYAKNAKRHGHKQVRMVADSIRRFGWAQPLVVDGDGVLIVGHCRLEAAKSLNLTEAPVVVMDSLSEQEVKALRLADNQLSTLGKVDKGMVSEELKDIDLELAQLTGFSPHLRLSERPDEDEVPVIEKAFVKRGERWSLGRHVLMCGDATSPEDMGKLMGGGEGRPCLHRPAIQR